MPTRRDVVSAAGATALSALAGCSGTGREAPADASSQANRRTDRPSPTFGGSSSGAVVSKTIEAERPADRGGGWVTVAELSYDQDSDRVAVRYDPGIVSGDISDGTLTVEKETHWALSTDFERTSYGFTLRAPAPERGTPVDDDRAAFQASVPRETFNRLPLRSVATVERYWRETETGRSAAVRVQSVSEPTEPPESVEVTTLDADATPTPTDASSS